MNPLIGEPRTKGLCDHSSCTQYVDEDAEEATKEGGRMSLGCSASPLPSSPKKTPLAKWMKRKLTCRLVNIHVVKKNVEQV